MEVENVTNKNRIESLEDWASKQDKALKDLEIKVQSLDSNGVMVEENQELTNLKKKVVCLEIVISSLKKSRHENLANSSDTEKVQECLIKKC